MSTLALVGPQRAIDAYGNLGVKIFAPKLPHVHKKKEKKTIETTLMDS